MAEIKNKPRPKPKRQTPGAEAWDEPKPAEEPRTKIDGAALVPKDIAAVSTKVYKYWIGVTSDCPAGHLDAGGIRFPKMEEVMDPDPSRKGQSLRRPVIGKIQPLREEQLRAIIEELPRLMIRMLANQNPHGSVKGYGVRIPTDKQVKEARKLGRPLPGYAAQVGDEPAARFMFAVLCPDQDSPTRGLHYPPSLEEIGLEWPDEMEP